MKTDDKKTPEDIVSAAESMLNQDGERNGSAPDYSKLYATLQSQDTPSKKSSRVKADKKTRTKANKKESAAQKAKT